jgi:hypothetical protein
MEAGIPVIVMDRRLLGDKCTLHCQDLMKDLTL